ncbi:MAG: patatin-like phospholipase family protein, partial [bacterium]
MAGESGKHRFTANAGNTFIVAFILIFCAAGTVAGGMVAVTDSVTNAADDSTRLMNWERTGNKLVTARRPRVGLVLSGGGAKSLAHIGVLKVIEEAGLHIDIVTGVSMGAVVGGFYAISYSPQKLEEIALSTDWYALLDDTPTRRDLSMEQKLYDEIYNLSLPFRNWKISLPSGVIQGFRINKMLSGYTWPVQNVTDFTDFPRPFAAVATDLETGDAVVLREGSLAEAIRASMSIPSVFAPMRIGDKLLIDGYVARNIPAQDAKELGADILIGVDVGTPPRSAEQFESMVDIINQTMDYQGREANTRQRAMLDILIQPDVADVGLLDFEHVEEIIRKGEEAARAHFTELKALADSLNAISPPPRLYYPISADSIYVAELKIDGLERTSKSVIFGAFNVPIPGWMSREELEGAVDRIYGTRYYKNVTYHLLPQPGGTSLYISVSEQKSAILRFGFHYDTNRKAAVRFNLTRLNWLLPGSFASADVKLGNTTVYDLTYFAAAGRQARVGVRLNFNMEQSDLVFTDQAGTTNPLNENIQQANLFTGSLYSTRFGAGGGITLIGSRIRIGQLERDDDAVVSLYGLIWYDTLDRLNFGTQGSMVQLLFTQSVHDIYNRGAFYLKREGFFDLNVPL